MVLFVTILVGACGPRPWMTPRPPLHPGNVVPSDAVVVYRAMGLLADTSRVHFVGSIRFLAGPTEDSSLAVLALSLRNNSLTFVPQAHDYYAIYHVDLVFRGDSGVTRQVSRDEGVRVSTVRETLRRDESVLFQELLTVPPGVYSVRVVVRDGNSPAVASVELTDTVPRFAGPSLGAPIPIYEGVGRARLAAMPQFIVNPRGTLRYGTDSVRFYVEGYHWQLGTRVVARIRTMDSVDLWRDTVALVGDTALASTTLVVKPGELPLGRNALSVEALGAPARAQVPLLVTFSERWAVADFDQMLTVLKYFNRQDLVARLRAAPRDQRGPAWRDFRRESDPDTLTPQNEALDEYFHRLELANEQYPEGVTPGWMTDRGEVFITLGDPDQTFDLPGTFPGLRWEYTQRHLSLVFRDQTGGLGQFHLTPDSRADFDKAVAVLRRPKSLAP